MHPFSWQQVNQTNKDDIDYEKIAKTRDQLQHALSCVGNFGMQTKFVC